MWSVLFSAFLIGLVSSFHCVGMCGPLMLSLPLQGLSGSGRALALVSYHAGRIGVYGIAGAVFGLLGRGIWLAGFQQVLSISIGVLILSIALFSRLHWFRAGQPAFLFSSLRALIFRLWQSPSRMKFLLMGMANGLLPCGMVYLAIAGAISTAHVGEAVLFMLIFGSGTLPLLVGFGYFGLRMGGSFRERIRKVVPVFVVCMGVLLILRGLGLGVPFVSPILPTRPGEAIICH